MNKRVPHRVTKAYARGLIGAVAIFAMSLVVVSWGYLSWFLGSDPIESDVSRVTAPGIVGLCLVMLVIVLWREMISLLRANPPSLVLIIVMPAAAYLFWSLLGVAFGLSIEETWLSPYALALAVSWLLAVIIFWWIAMRKLYSGKDRPRWPWEKNELNEGPDYFKDGLQ